MQTQWRSVAIDQQMPLGARFGTIGRIWSGGCAAQGRRQQFGIGRLPAPIDTADLIVNAQQSCENGSEDAANMIYHFALYDFDEAHKVWNSLTPEKRRSTHPEKAAADYEVAGTLLSPTPAPPTEHV